MFTLLPVDYKCSSSWVTFEVTSRYFNMFLGWMLREHGAIVPPFHLPVSSFKSHETPVFSFFFNFNSVRFSPWANKPPIILLWETFDVLCTEGICVVLSQGWFLFLNLFGKERSRNLVLLWVAVTIFATYGVLFTAIKFVWAANSIIFLAFSTRTISRTDRVHFYVNVLVFMNVHQLLSGYISKEGQIYNFHIRYINYISIKPI